MSISVNENAGEKMGEGDGIWGTIWKLSECVALFLTGCLCKQNIFNILCLPEFSC